MKYLPLITILLLAFSVHGQQGNIDPKFITDFTKALDKNFSEKHLDDMFENYSELLTPHSDVTQFAEQLKGHELQVYPLYEFKNTKLYTDNISNLLNSTNPNQRILAYLVIASSDDKSKENILLEKIKTETAKGNLIWAGSALLYLPTEHTTALFDFLVKNEDFGDAHMLPLFIKLNKDSLQQTAYKRINSNDVTTKVLAAQTLSATTLNPHTEELLKQAVKDWDINIKGYAIFPISQLQIGNLLEIMKPLVDSTKTRAIAMQALANSPTEADQHYLRELANKKDTVPDDLLDCFYDSKNVANVKYWTRLLYTKPLPPKYFFSVFKQPLIKSDDELPELQTALQKIKDPDILDELVRALDGRTDDASIDIMIGFLKNENNSVKYWTARTLAANPSPKLENADVKELLKEGLEDGNK